MELSRDTRNLINLRHLDFNSSTLTHMPEEMGKLNCPQTLSYFVLDYERSNQLSEPTVLIHLKGDLRIKNLEQLSYNPSELSLVNLKDIKGFKNLELEWNLSPDDQEYEGEDDETSAMEGLERHSNVESLHIDGYSGVGLPNWVSTLLLKLTRITIYKCHRLQHLTQIAHLQALTFLFLDDMSSLEFIDKNEPSSSSSFPSLELLIIENMPNLEGWWELGNTQKNWLPPTFSTLISLHISRCPKFRFMPKPASTGTVVFLRDVSVQLETTLDPLWGLECLTLEKIKDLKYLETMESQLNISSLPIQLRDLEINKCSNLMSLPEWISSITSLEELEIMKCPKLKVAFASAVAPK